MTESQVELEQLAQNIASDAQEYISLLRKNGCALPSHDPQAPRNEALPLEVSQMQTRLMDLSLELQALVLGPRMQVHRQISAHSNLINLHALYRFGIPGAVPADGSISYAELANKIQVAEDVVRRLARYSLTMYIFREVDGDRLAHSATSRMLAESPIMMDWIGMVCEEMWPAATQTVPALVRWHGSQEPQHSGFAQFHGRETHLFDGLAGQPERAARFANAMKFFQSNPNLSPKFLCEAFEWWDSVSQVVDVGGSTGITAVALATRLPHVRVVIQDQALLEGEARKAIPPQVADRVSFMAHDFFQEQPVRGADVYHFRWILHDWPDKACLGILRALVPALKPGARVVLSEFVVPEPGTAPRYKENLVRGFDLAMMELLNGKERERQDWERLFGEADARFRFDRVRMVKGSDLAFISAVWEPERT